MARAVLYDYFRSSAAYRARIALNLKGIDYEQRQVSLVEGAQKDPAYRALNPFGQIPTLDDDGVVVTESGAILLYLARKSGKLMPRDLAGEAQVLRWSFAALTTIELPVLSLWFVNLSGGKDSKPSEALLGWAEMRLKQLDGWLANRHFIATEEFTVADILMTHVLVPHRYSLEPYPNLVAYRARCYERPAWKKAHDAYCERVEAA